MRTQQSTHAYCNKTPNQVIDPFSRPRASCRLCRCHRGECASISGRLGPFSRRPSAVHPRDGTPSNQQKNVERLRPGLEASGGVVAPPAAVRSPRECPRRGPIHTYMPRGDTSRSEAHTHVVAKKATSNNTPCPWARHACREREKAIAAGQKKKQSKTQTNLLFWGGCNP